MVLRLVLSARLAVYESVCGESQEAPRSLSLFLTRGAESCRF